jgi:hypothetical protein
MPLSEESSVCSDNQNIDNDDSHSNWEEITGDNDSQPQTNIQYQELQGPKHAPPTTAGNATFICN